MALPLPEASLSVLDENNRPRAKLIIKPSSKDGNFLLFEATRGEMDEWGEEQIQLVEECRYEYELISSGSERLRLREIPAIITRSVLPERSNTGTIEPGTHVGLFPIVVENDSGEMAASIAVEIRSSKLEYREHYRRMLNYIADRCTDLILQIRSPTQGRFRPKTSEPSHTIAQRFAFIRSLISNDEFKSAIGKILAEPHVRSSVIEREQEINRGFRPNSRTLMQIGSGQPRTKLSKDSPLAKILSSVPSKIKVIKQFETVDTVENRFVKHALESFDIFLSDMTNVLEMRQQSPANNRLLSEIGSLRKKLAVPLSHNLFRGISELSILPLGSSVLQRREGYREILLAWIRFDAAARLVWSGGEDVYGGGKRDIASLYEYWIFFKLLDVISSVFDLNTPKVEDLIEETEDGFALKLKAGHRLLIEATSHRIGRPLKIRFAYNRTFSNENGATDSITYPKPGSWTQSMRPDYTLSLWPAGLDETVAEETELMWHIHFDSKYKVTGNYEIILGINDIFGEDTEKELVGHKQAQKRGRFAKRSDLMTMHAYRDAIRRTEGAYLIYPGDESIKWRAFVEILPGLGAFAVNPGAENDGMDNIHQFLTQLSYHARNRATLRERERYHSHVVYSGDEPSDVFLDLPETEINNKRMKPPQEHFILICSSRGGLHDEWVMRSGTFDFSPPDGLIEPNLLMIKHILIVNNNAVVLGPLKRVSEETKLCSGGELIREGCPGIPSQKGLYVVFRTQCEDNSQWLDLDWNKAIPRVDKLPYLTNLSHLFGSQ